MARSKEEFHSDRLNSKIFAVLSFRGAATLALMSGAPASEARALGREAHDEYMERARLADYRFTPTDIRS